MESIVITTLPNDLNMECSLNQYGRKRFGTINDLICTKSGTKSTVCLNTGNDILMENVRKSTHYRRACRFTFDMNEVIEAFKTLAPSNREPYVEWLKPNQMCDIIEYLPGGFFAPHKDKKHNRFHYATLLIFPPAVGEFAHTGGQLIITKSDGTKFMFDSSLNQQWTCIAFHQELEHECKIVNTGRRVVIKTGLNYAYFRTAKIPHNRDYIQNNFPIIDGNLPIF